MNKLERDIEQIEGRLARIVDQYEARKLQARLSKLRKQARKKGGRRG